ncbi:mitochondrial RNA-splicing protein MRS3-like [Planoprotostelium fungivorum]|uniref:Mitochondrial RNA-splicing protein MRS3-like n=1 Tax=Planoprotostelium fungivorum TaxID=1890364 RepID=A0A2P6NLE2_9EUKA|nr:mitochondrial RNA-splicing protein MRS3-like [Planoprotostelium fungivorum]
MGDHEEYKPGDNVFVHMLAGAAAGTAEHCGMFPIDTIKAHGSAFTSIRETASHIATKNGVVGFFRGISALALGAAPAHALHFATYEYCKKKFENYTLGISAAGICATMISDAVMTPMDAVKQRMQLGVKNYKGMLDCMRSVIRAEGFGSLYAGYTTTLVMNVPYNAVQFTSYEALRSILKKGKEDEFDVVAHCVAGGGAGAIAGAITNPFDVVRTRLQTRGDTGAAYKGMVSTLVQLWKNEGRRGYTRGMLPRITLHSTSAAISWATYEYVKILMQRQLWTLITFLIFLYVNSSFTQGEIISERYPCPNDCSNHGVCNINLNTTQSVCRCVPGYTGVDCSYQQRSRVTALLLSFFLGTLGAERFYLGQVELGITKLLLCLFICILPCCLLWLACMVPERQIGRMAALPTMMTVLVILAVFVWWMTDWILILTNKVTDVNGVSLSGR